MGFVSTDQVIDQLVDILEQHFEKRRKELTNGPEKVQPVRKWVSDEHAFPGESDRGDYPKGVVGFDERASERREQDTGETATMRLVVRIYISPGDLDKSTMDTICRRYGDGLMYAIMREGRGKNPDGDIVVPGLFRYWPTRMKSGEFQEVDLMGCEVNVDVIVDSSFTASV